MPDPPPLTMQDPNDPDAPFVEPPGPAPLGRGFKVVIALLAGLLVSGVVGYEVIATKASNRDSRLNAESSLLRFGVVGISTGTAGADGSAVVDARVRLVVRNLSPLTIRIVTLAVDGGPPTVDGPAASVPPKADADLQVVWRVRCAEIGNVAGPSLLTLAVRGPVGDHVLRVSLPAFTRTAFHSAAVTACGVP